VQALPVSVDFFLATTNLNLARWYVTTCQKYLCLDHWNIKVTNGTVDDGYAQVIRLTERDAEIQLDPKWWTATPEEKREIIAHELIHLHTWLLAELVPDSHASARTEVEERLVDILAKAFAPFLPSWRSRSWKKKKDEE
jgi:hypothetical protein